MLMSSLSSSSPSPVTTATAEKESGDGSCTQSVVEAFPIPDDADHIAIAGLSLSVILSFSLFFLSYLLTHKRRGLYHEYSKYCAI